MSKSKPYLKKNENGFYYVHWTENRVGRRVSTKVRDLVAAKQFMRRWADWLKGNPWHSGTYLPQSVRQSIAERECESPKFHGDSIFAEPEPLGPDATLRDVWSIYFSQRVLLRNASPYTATMSWNQLEPFFGNLPATSLTQNAVDAYVQARTSGSLGRKVKPQTAGRELRCLVAAVRFCARRRRQIPEAAVRELELPAHGDPKERWLREQEIETLLNGARSFYGQVRLGRGEIFIWLALYTAGREQALIDLTWDRVDLEDRIIHLDVPGRMKTKKRRASVPIADSLLPILERAYRERINDRVLMNGGAIWPTIQSIVMHAGLAPKRRRDTSKKPKATGISPNVFRHTAATMMARRGVPLWKIAKILGNTLAMVERVYAKYCPDDLRDAVNLISRKQKND